MSMGWRRFRHFVFALCVASASLVASAQEAAPTRRLAQEAVRPVQQTEVARPVQRADTVREVPPPAMSVSQMSTVPSLVGQPESRVGDLLGPLHLVKGSATTQESDRPTGTVLSQDPRAGNRVRFGTVIYLVVSSGPPTQSQSQQVRVPDVAGTQSSVGRQLLARMRLRMGDVDSQTARSPSGTILRQNPRAGSLVDPGTSIDVVVSTGPGQAPPPDDGQTRPQEPDRPSRPPVDVTISLPTKPVPNRPVDESPRVPNVVGKMFPSDDTTRTLTNATLHIGTVVRDYTSREPFGTVVKQVPAANTPLKRGSGVDLLVSGAGGPAVPPTAPPIEPPSTTKPPPPGLVPNVVGLASSVASNRIAQARFAPSARTVQGTEAEGTVVAQRPVAGTRATLGAAVTIDVSDGSLVVVPRVEGRDADDADSIVARAGLQAQRSTAPSNGRPDTVVSQTPAAGTEVRRGSTVAVVVAIARTVEVPDLESLSADDAKTRLAPSLKFVSSAPMDSPTVAKDRVISQEPKAGDVVPIGTTVAVVLSLGPPPIPDFTGRPIDDARQAATNAGTPLTEPERVFDGAPSGTVLRQSVTPNARVAPGTPVTLVVSRGPLWPWVVTTVVATLLVVVGGAAAALWPPVRYRVLVKNHKVTASTDALATDGPALEMRVHVEHGERSLKEAPNQENPS